MIPSVSQQLEAIKRRLIESVVPQLPADAAFAHEQVLLIGAALDFLIETHEHEYRAAVVENHEYRDLLRELQGRRSTPDDEVSAVLAEDGPARDDGAVELRMITEQTVRLKELGDRLYRELAGRGDTVDRPVSDLLAGIAERQVEREASWFRGAGFTRDAVSIGELLRGSA
jgi:hypothetical protein